MWPANKVNNPCTSIVPSKSMEYRQILVISAKLSKQQQKANLCLDASSSS